MQEYSYSYTKHIYAGTQRIASKVGDIEAFGADPRREEYAGANLKEADFGSKYEQQTKALLARYDSLGVMNKPRELNDYVGGQSFCCGEKEFEPSQTGKDEFETPDYEHLIFFYHPDHLGSTALVTDNDGNVVQSVAYIPYGEVFIEERNGTWNTPYLFNGKELDEETGLYYYGARYLNPTSAVWMSVDPKFEDFAGITPYGYCLGNPIKLVDPDGEVPWIAVAAFIGGAVNGGIALVQGKSLKEVGAAAVGGAVAGALMTVGAGWSNVVMGAIGSGTGNAIEQGINIATGNQQDFDGKQLGVAATVGAGANVAGKFINKKFLTSAKKQLNAAKESKVMNLKEAQSKVIKENPYLKIKKGGDPQFKQKNLELQTKAHNEVEISQWQKDRNVQAAQNRYDKWSRQESKTYETCSDATQNITSQGINYLSNRDEK